MKKILLPVLILTAMVACAQPSVVRQGSGNGLFGRGESAQTEQTAYSNRVPGLPDHGQDGDRPATPLGSGVLALSVLGGAYLIRKKTEKEN